MDLIFCLEFVAMNFFWKVALTDLTEGFERFLIEFVKDAGSVAGLILNLRFI